MRLTARDWAGLAVGALVRPSMFHLIYFVTARCNQRCRFCFYWRAREASACGDELSVGEVARIARGMPRFVWLQLSGGEPFLREDVDELCALFVRNNGVRHITIPTNGGATERICATVERILGRNPQVGVNVSLSVHGVDADHDRLAGVDGSFARLQATASRLWELRGRQARLSVGGILTQSTYNEARLEATVDWIHANMKLDHLTLNLARGEPREPGCTRCDPDIYRRCSRRLTRLTRAQRRRWSRVPGVRILALNEERVRDTVHRAMIGRPARLPCLAGRASFVMSPTGEVYPCELLDRPLGSLRASGYDFRRVAGSPEARAARRMIRGGGCSCTHECFLTVNLLFNRRLYPWYLYRYLTDALRDAGSARGQG